MNMQGFSVASSKEKKIIWVGSSRKDLTEQPKPVRVKVGYALWKIQEGKHHESIKPLKGLAGVYEIRADYDKDTYRTVYTIKLGDDIYVLHVFKKKSKHGIETPKPDMDVIHERLKRAKEIADEKQKEKSKKEK
jgi:phage-related protein